MTIVAQMALEFTEQDCPQFLESLLPPRIDPSMVTGSVLGRVMRQARQTVGLNQRDLAAKINERPALLSDIEQGKFVLDQRIISKFERVPAVHLREEKDRTASIVKCISEGEGNFCVFGTCVLVNKAGKIMHLREEKDRTANSVIKCMNARKICSWCFWLLNRVHQAAGVYKLFLLIVLIFTNLQVHLLMH